MTIPTITALPTAPSRGASPDTFATVADAFMAALPTMGTEFNTSINAINAAALVIDGDATAASDAAIAAAASAATASAAATTAVNAPGTNATSTTSLAVGTGSRSLTIQTGKAFVIGQFVTITSTASPANWMHGNITAHNSGTGALTVNVGTTGGSGTFAAWTVALSGPSAAGTSLPLAGGTMTGKVTLAASASGGSGINAPPGVDPSAPANGDIWTTATALRTRLGGVNRTVAFSTDLDSRQPLDPTLTALAGVTTAADRLIYATGVDTFAVTALTSIARNLLEGTTNTAMRSTLGLGSLATASTVNNGNWSGTDLAVANGGTGASDAATAFANIAIAAQSLSSTGYVKLQNGLHLMWGSQTFWGAGSTTTVTYPVALTAWSVAVVSGANTGDTDRNGPFVTGTSTTDFTAFSRSTTSVSGWWLAVGV